MITIIIDIHSKHFSVSDLLKSHHNQLLLTKFGRSLRYMKSDVNSTAWLPENWTVNLEDLGTRLSLQKDRTFNSFREEETGELLAKNVVRTARIQLDGWNLLFE